MTPSCPLFPGIVIPDVCPLLSENVCQRFEVEQEGIVETYLFTAVPRIIERTGSEAFKDPIRFRYKAAIPSPLPYPSAEASKV